MRSAISRSSSSRSAFTRAAAALIRPSQRATGMGMGSPETGKLPKAFSVSPPHRGWVEVVSVMGPSVERGRRMDVVDSPQRCDRIGGVGTRHMPALWEPAGIYLNTASYGLPPTPAWDALQEALEEWRGGGTSWEHWGIPGEGARAPFARIVGVPVETGATGVAPALDAISLPAAEHGVMTVVDPTQAVGWLPIDASRFDVVAAHGYK